MWTINNLYDNGSSETKTLFLWVDWHGDCVIYVYTKWLTK